MAIDMTPGGGAPTLTLTSGVAETGKGLYGTGDTGALISTGSRNSVEAPPPSTYTYSAADYTPEQPTEQRVTLPETVVEAKKESSPPPSVAEEKVAPPEITIDIVKDFDWTASVNKQQLQDKIPYIRLKEFKITADNALNAIAAGVFAWADMQKSGAGAVGKAAGVAGSAMDQVDFLKNIKDSKFTKVIADQAGVLGSGIDSFVDTAKQAVGRISTPTDFGPEGQHLQDVYGGLYARESTGRTYILPYFDNDYFQANNDFQETTTIPFMNEAFEMVSQAANTLPALVEPGVYVQRPKFYNFDAAENQLSFSVTLYNTITPMAYLQNSQLVQQLIVNNLPRRKSKVVVEPPCIYEVLIPGKAFYPYCFITDLRVLHVGTKRLMQGEIVPEAFELQMTIKSLVKDANNFYEKQMLHHEMTFPPPKEASLPSFDTPPGDVAQQGQRPGVGDAAQQRESIATPSGPGGGDAVLNVDAMPQNLKKLAPDFIAAGKKYNIDPNFLVAISMNETGNGTSKAFIQGNNAMGISNSKGPVYGYSTPSESIDKMAKGLTNPNGYYKGAHTIGQIGNIYSPVGAANDPRGLNSSWIPTVGKNYKKLTGKDANSVVL